MYIFVVITVPAHALVTTGAKTSTIALVPGSVSIRDTHLVGYDLKIRLDIKIINLWRQ